MVDEWKMCQRNRTHWGSCPTHGYDSPRRTGSHGQPDTDYLSKAKTTLQLLQENIDFVLVHIEGIDEVSHNKNAKAKIKAIEDSSEILVRHLIENIPDDVSVTIPRSGAVLLIIHCFVSTGSPRISGMENFALAIPIPRLEQWTF
jgi:2,3-bisphosphoglycerate-independent phosphoglycerate mutase